MTQKRIAMIPVLLGSTRIPEKNLILVDGAPMVWRIAKACKDAGIFDEILINSEHERFREIAAMLGIGFFKRDPAKGGSACRMKSKSRQCSGDRCQTHDHFITDFIEQKGPCTLIQVHTTSPLLTPETIKRFVTKFEEGGYDSFFTVEEKHIETLWDGKPLNFSFSKKVPTQSLPPLQMLSWALSGWKSQSFLDSYKRDDPNENGPTFCGKTGFFPLDRVEALDADTPEDLFMIEACLRHRRQKEKPGAFRLNEDDIGIEHELRDLIGKDGVTTVELDAANARLTNIEDIKKKMGPAPWIHLLVYSSADQTALICQRPGEGARKHRHVTHEEWWVILEGDWEWRFADGTVTKAKKGDVIVCPRGLAHQIVCVGDKPGIRLSNGARDFEHIYVR